MFRKLPLFLLVFLVSALASCYKDLGNYDYKDINEIQFEGIQDSYTAVLGEPFKITPVLKFTQDPNSDTSQYTYEWIGLRLDNVLPAEQKKEIAKTRNLDIVMTLPPAPYRVWYRVTDKKTGVQWKTEFNLKVVTSIYEGWLVLNDVNNKARLDMVSFLNGQPKTIIDVLGTVGSKLPPQGKPKYVYTYNFQPNTYGIYISTESGTNRVNPETFDWDPTYNIKFEMLGNVRDNFITDLIVSPTVSTAYLHAGNDVYYYYRIFNINYSLPINMYKGETKPFKAAPFMAANSGPAAILYDEDNRRFVRHVNNESTVSAMPTGTLFDYNTGKDLVYMANSTFGSGEVFSILKDPADGKFYLARFTFPRTGSYVQTYYAEMTATEIAEAESFAVSPDMGYIFYNVSGKLYEYDMSAKRSKLMLDKGAEKISYISFNKSVDKNKLMVGTYNPATAAAGTGGVLASYTVPQVQGDLVLDKSYTGFGKIVSVDYRTR
jgi:hypothetical protein